MGGIDAWVGAFKRTRAVGSVVHKARLHLLQYVNIALNLQVTERVVRETRMPNFWLLAFGIWLLAIAFQNIGIVMRTPCLPLIHQSVFIQCLTWRDLQLLTSMAYNGNLWIASQILTHIEHEDRILT